MDGTVQEDIVGGLRARSPDEALDDVLRIAADLAAVPEPQRVPFLHFCLGLGKRFEDAKEHAKGATLLEIVLRFAPNNPWLYRQLFLDCVISGQARKAAAAARRYCEGLETLCASHSLGALNIRFLADHWLVGRIGELTEQLHTLARARLSGLLPDYHCILLAPKSTICNVAMLDYFRPYVSVITDDDTIRNMAPLAQQLPLSTYLFRLNTGAVGLNTQINAIVERTWVAQNRPPLLSLRLDHHQAGWEVLKAHGMREGDWFVTLHIRQAGFTPADGDDSAYHSLRNSEIADILPAVEEIIARGGWVVRIGHPHMTPWPSQERVIDLSRDGQRPDWLDVFACAENRFFLGSSSGPLSIPKCFGRPSVIIDHFTVASTFPCSKSIVLPKLCHSRVDGRLLVLDEMLQEPLRDMQEPGLLEVLQLDMIPASAEQIRAGAVEMMDSLDGVLPPDSQCEKAHGQAVASYARIGRALNTRFSRDFIRSHPDWFQPPARPWHGCRE